MLKLKGRELPPIGICPRRDLKPALTQLGHGGWFLDIGAAMFLEGCGYDTQQFKLLRERSHLPFLDIAGPELTPEDQCDLAALVRDAGPIQSRASPA